jgi:ribosomal-protein-alanine N-acetyltransferase
MSAVLKEDYQLRPMTQEDLDTVMVIEPTIYSHPWSRGNFTDSLQAGYSAWVLTLHEEIIGYMLMMIALNEAHLLNISVAAPYQKQGFGHVLLEHMLDKAKHYKATDIFLEVRASNTSAVGLYESHGFVEVSVRRGYYPAGAGREDAILMGLVL